MGGSIHIHKGADGHREPACVICLRCTLINYLARLLAINETDSFAAWPW